MCIYIYILKKFGFYPQKVIQKLKKKKIPSEPRKAGCSRHITGRMWLWPSFCVVTTPASLGHSGLTASEPRPGRSSVCSKVVWEVPKGWFLGSLKAY